MKLQVVKQYAATIACEWETDDGRRGCAEVGKYVIDAAGTGADAWHQAAVYFQKQGWQLGDPVLCPDCVGKPTDGPDPREDEVPAEDSDEITTDDIANAEAYRKRYARFMSILTTAHKLAKRLHQSPRGVRWD